MGKQASSGKTEGQSPMGIRTGAEDLEQRRHPIRKDGRLGEVLIEKEGDGKGDQAEQPGEQSAGAKVQVKPAAGQRGDKAAHQPRTRAMVKKRKK